MTYIGSRSLSCNLDKLLLLYKFRLLRSFNDRRMSTINFKLLSLEDKREFLNSFDTVLSDCDGVLWLGGKAIDGAVEVMNTFKSIGKKTYFVTNNSTQTRKEFVSKCTRLGFNAEEDDIISTAWLTAQYLKCKNFKKKVYLLGSKAIQHELSLVGIQSTGLGPEPMKGDISNISDIEVSKLDKEVGAVVVGYDVHFSVPKMIKACTYLSDPECIFIGTNTDENFPNRKKLVWPGTGTFVIAIETGAQRKAIIMGKPSTYVSEILHERGLNSKRTLMIGDRCNTDIFFGNRCEMVTLLVLTGIHKVEDVHMFEKNKEEHLVPKFYTDSIEDLLEILK